MKYSVIQIPYLPGCPIHVKVNDTNSEELHRHSGLEIIWLFTGKLKVTIGQNDYHLHENNLLLINHFESHRVVPQALNTRFIQLHVDSLFIFKHNHDFYNLNYDLKSIKNSEDNQHPYDVVRILFSRLVGKGKKIKMFSGCWAT